MFKSTKILAAFCKSSPLKMSQRIKNKLLSNMQIKHLDIINQSQNHARGQESHYNLLVVSNDFKGKMLVEKQRLVYSVLKEEMGLIHALTLTCRTEEEWDKQQQKIQSPLCVNKIKK